MIIVIKYLFTLWLSTVLLFSILQSVQGNETSSFEYSTYQSSNSTASFTQSSVPSIDSSTTNTSTTTSSYFVNSSSTEKLLDASSDIFTTNTSSYFVKSPSTENLSSTSGISISSSVPETSFTTIFSSFLTTDSSKMFTSSYTFAAPLSSSINTVSVFYTSSSQNIFTSTFYKGYDFVACEQKNNCKNGGSCALNKSNNSTICLCNHNYFGDECQYEEIIPHVYKQLAYGFGGTTVFLLLVVVFLTCCCSKNRLKKDSSYEYSKELDEFTIANKRASTFVKPSVLNAYDVYAS